MSIVFASHTDRHEASVTENGRAAGYGGSEEEGTCWCGTVYSVTGGSAELDCLCSEILDECLAHVLSERIDWNLLPTTTNWEERFVTGRGADQVFQARTAVVVTARGSDGAQNSHAFCAGGTFDCGAERCMRANLNH